MGIRVHENNHLIVRGPLPDRATALALIRQWSVIQIGAIMPVALENGDLSPAVAQLLNELSLRRIAIHNFGLDSWQLRIAARPMPANGD